MRDKIEITKAVEEEAPVIKDDKQRAKLIKELTKEMLAAARELQFEKAAALRDKIQRIEREQK